MSIELRTSIYGEYYGSTIGNSSYLSDEDKQKVNVDAIYKALSDKGWTINAISAILGNMQTESHFNPGVWQGNDVENPLTGFGLVQWTPATKYINWCKSEYGNDVDYTTLEHNIDRIMWEVDNKEQWGPRKSFNNMSFEDFTRSTLDVGYLTKAFMLCYERPLDQSEVNQESRAQQGIKWHNYLLNEAQLGINLEAILETAAYYADDPDDPDDLIVSESKGNHYTEIISKYNQYTGATWNRNTAWCAIFVSTLFLQNGYTSDDFPVNANCERMSSIFKSRGQWIEPYVNNKRVIPNRGDIIFFDTNVSNGTTSKNHVGIVYDYDDTSQKITVIDGNWSDKVCQRKLDNTKTVYPGNYTISGYGRPKYSTIIGAVPIITGISQVSPTEIEINFLAYKNPTNLDRFVCYYDWDEDVNPIDYAGMKTIEKDSNVFRIPKLRSATYISAIIVRYTYTGEEYMSELSFNTLEPSYPSVPIYYQGSYHIASPFIFTKGSWKPAVPMIWDNNYWYELYNTDSVKQ
jgi:hypothetical protein